MLINGIKATNYSALGETLLMQLSCAADEALAMDTSIVKVTTDDGDLVEQFIGYTKLSASVDAITKEVTLKCFKDDSGITQAMSSLIESNEVNTGRIDGIETSLNSLTSAFTASEVTNA